MGKRRSWSIWLILVPALLLVMLLATRVRAQESPWELVQTSDGTLYLLHDGVASQVTPGSVTSDVLSTFLQGPPVTDGVLPIELGPVPTEPAVATVPTLPPFAVSPLPTAAPVVVPTLNPYPTEGPSPTLAPPPTYGIPTVAPFPTQPTPKNPFGL